MSNDSKTFTTGLLILGVVAISSCCGCGALTRQVARDATPAAVDSGIQAGVSDENQETIVQAIDPERVERATEKVAGAVTDGWTNAMDQDERQARIALAVTPVMAKLVSESIEVALTDEHLTRVRELAKQATLGFQDAIDEVSEQRDLGTIPSDRGNVLEAVDELAEGGQGTLYVIGAIALALAVLLGVGVVWALKRKRRHEQESVRQSQALAAAVRVLSRKGVPMDEEPASPSTDGRPSADIQADVDLVRTAARRMAGAR